MESLERVSTHYKDRSAAAYFRKQQRLTEIKGKLNSRKFAAYVDSGDSVVDFGCGDGGLLARLNACEKVGVDVNPWNREAAAARGVRTVEFAEELPSESADVVISNHALEHTLHPLEELRRMHARLKPNGRLVIYLPVDDWRIQKSYRPNDPNHHLYTWTPLLFGHLLAEAGFRVVDSRVVHHAWPGRLTPMAARLPKRLFGWVMIASAFATRRRELCALATRRSG